MMPNVVVDEVAGMHLRFSDTPCLFRMAKL